MIWSKWLYLMLCLQAEARMGFLKEKAWSLWGNEGGVSLLFFWAVASGFQDVSQDNKLGQGRSCSQVQEGQSDHWPLWLASDVYYERWERVSIKPWAIKWVGITESWAVPWVRNLAWLGHGWSGGLGTGLTLSRSWIQTQLHPQPWALSFIYLIKVYWKPIMQQAFSRAVSWGNAISAWISRIQSSLSTLNYFQPMWWGNSRFGKFNFR